MRLPQSCISVRTGSGIGVRNGDQTVGLARDYTRTVLRIGEHPFQRLEEAVVRVRVAVRPAIDGDVDDVTRRIEAACTQHASQLIANVPLECLERGGQ